MGSRNHMSPNSFSWIIEGNNVISCVRELFSMQSYIKWNSIILKDELGLVQWLSFQNEMHSTLATGQHTLKLSISTVCLKNATLGFV